VTSRLRRGACRATTSKEAAMISSFEVKGFEAVIAIVTALHVTKFVIVELLDLWIFICNLTASSRCRVA
jgi:hypothetical protein